MKKHIIILLSSALVSFTAWAQSNPVMGTLLLNGKEIAAEYTISGGTASLGSGRNACIPQYSKGRVIVPATITVNGSTYNVTAVSSMAFRLCNGISFVQLPEGVTHIDEFAFKGCRELVDISLPSTLEHIASGAFIGLPKLHALYCQAETPPQWDYNDVFVSHEGGIGSTQTYHNEQTTLYVPMAKVDDYRNSAFSDETIGWTTPDGWQYFAKVKGSNDYETEWGIGISTPLALNNFRSRVVNGETFANKIIKLEADIDMENQVWDSGIGGKLGYFKGKFDGQHHTIKNLKITTDADNTHQYLGFFNYIVDATVTNLRIDNIYVEGFSERNTSVGLIAGGSNYCEISNCYVKNSKVYSFGDAGIMSGSTNCSSFNKCVSVNNGLVHLISEYDPYTQYDGSGGIVGEADDASIKDCAIIGSRLISEEIDTHPCGPFVGTGSASVERSYSDVAQFKGYEPPSGITFADDVLIHGMEVWVPALYQSRGLEGALIKNFLVLGPYLGLDDWVYCIGEYPLPDCFEDLYEVKVNHFSLRPATLTTPRPNALTPTSKIEYDDWSTANYRFGSFTASSLWIDDNLSYWAYEKLPIGTATIECTNGVRYDRTLTAPEDGTISVEYPVYQTDEEGMIVLDEDGKRIPTGDMRTVEETVYQPTAYCFSLPYPLTFSNGIHLYQPTEVKMTSDEVAQVTFEEKADLHADAWTPYYAIVDAGAISLSTEEHITLLPQEDHTVDVGNGYFFAGSPFEIKKNDTEDYQLQSDRTWRKGGGDLLLFRTYFYSTNESQASYITTFATTLLKNDEDNSAIIERNDLTTTNITLEGRTLFKDNSWNTLCLPFDVTIDDSPLSGASAKTLTSSEFDNTTGELTLNFSDASTIKAGTPFIIKWEGDGTNNLVEPVFENVTINDVLKPAETDFVNFKGFYSPIKIEGEDQTILYLGAGDQIFYPNAAMTIGACRAAFQLKGITAGEPTTEGQTIKAFVLNFGDEESGIRSISESSDYSDYSEYSDHSDHSYYSLDGRRLSGKPVQKGFYLRGDKKMLIK